MDPDLLAGRGYPFSLMYADLLLYPAALLRILGFSLQTVYKLYVAAVTLATALLTRYVLRRMLKSESLALVGTALYVLSFYRLTNVFVRASVGEYSAMLFLPLVIYGLWRIYTQPLDGGKGQPWWLGGAGHRLYGAAADPPADHDDGRGAVFCVLPGGGAADFPQTGFSEPVQGGRGGAGLELVVPCSAFAVYADRGLLHQRAVQRAEFVQQRRLARADVHHVRRRRNGRRFRAGVCEPADQRHDRRDAAFAGHGAGPGRRGSSCWRCWTPAVRGADRGGLRLGGWALGFGALCVYLASDLFPWYALSLRQDPLSQALSSLLGKLQYVWTQRSTVPCCWCWATCCGLLLYKAKRPDWARLAGAAALLLTVIPAGYLLYETCTTSPVLNYMSLGSFGIKEDQVAGGEYMPYDLPDDGTTDYDGLELSAPEGVATADVVRGGSVGPVHGPRTQPAARPRCCCRCTPTRAMR